jgi:hypothetical protein
MSETPRLRRICAREACRNDAATAKVSLRAREISRLHHRFGELSPNLRRSAKMTAVNATQTALESATGQTPRKSP